MDRKQSRQTKFGANRNKFGAPSQAVKSQTFYNKNVRQPGQQQQRRNNTNNNRNGNGNKFGILNKSRQIQKKFRPAKNGIAQTNRANNLNRFRVQRRRNNNNNSNFNANNAKLSELRSVSARPQNAFNRCIIYIQI